MTADGSAALAFCADNARLAENVEASEESRTVGLGLPAGFIGVGCLLLVDSNPGPEHCCVGQERVGSP
jgi:hypothetical protein